MMARISPVAETGFRPGVDVHRLNQADPRGGFGLK